MFRTLLLSLVALAAMLIVDAQTAEARRLFSLRNPYTSFNISGVNYGSVNWERQHGNRSTVYGGRRGMLGR